MSGLPEREKAILQRLKGDFPHYAEKCLKIRPKKGEIIAFELNRVQREIHDRLERQLAERPARSGRSFSRPVSRAVPPTSRAGIIGR